MKLRNFQRIYSRWVQHRLSIDRTACVLYMAYPIIIPHRVDDTAFIGTNACISIYRSGVPSSRGNHPYPEFSLFLPLINSKLFLEKVFFKKHYSAPTAPIYKTLVASRKNPVQYSRQVSDRSQVILPHSPPPTSTKRVKPPDI